MTSPTPSSTNVPVLPRIKWTSVPDATSYTISIGTSPNGSEVINNQNVGIDAFYQITTALPYNVTIYVRITAQNNTGSSQGCMEYSFVTMIPPIPEMVLVPSGTIRLGGQPPVTPVTIDTFYMGKYEVTQKQWREVMNGNTNGISATPSSFSACGEDCPVEQVSWYDILVFCNRFSIQEGRMPVYRINGNTNPNTWGQVPTSSNTTWNSVAANWAASGYRLPTEAEWEYAARGASNDPDFIWAGTNVESELVNYTWYSANNSPSGTKIVGQKLPNTLGFHDMSGNVAERCWDWLGGSFPTSPNNPRGPSTGSWRMGRGAWWFDVATNCSVSARNISGSNPPQNRVNGLGFRLAASQ
jgi:formylglycine-generating enzyme required for sulfatase activity